MFNTYIKDYNVFDKYYRKFYQYYDRCIEKDDIVIIRDKIENSYTNWYLEELSLKWNTAIQNEKSWVIDGITNSINSITNL